LGLTARIIIIYATKKGKTVVAPFQTDAEHRLREQLMIDLEKISMMSGNFKISGPALEVWSKWYPLQDINPPFSDSRLAAYAERRGSHILKLSMIMSAARSGTGVIEKEDIDKAIDELEEMEKMMPRAFSGIGKSKMSDILVKVMTFIANKKEVTMEQLMRNFYFDADKIEMAGMLATMESMKVIRIGTTGYGEIIRYTGKEATL
jgi:hypothetical protein